MPDLVDMQDIFFNFKYYEYFNMKAFSEEICYLSWGRVSASVETGQV